MFDDISGKKMASARESNKDGSCSEYEQRKQENIERNKRRLASLNLKSSRVWSTKAHPKKIQRLASLN
jgi:hypothetical protein